MSNTMKKRPPKKTEYHSWASVDITPTAYSARVIQLIETNLERKGSGAEGDPVRHVTQYWTLDGRLLFEIDPIEEA